MRAGCVGNRQLLQPVSAWGGKYETRKYSGSFSFFEYNVNSIVFFLKFLTALMPQIFKMKIPRLSSVCKQASKDAYSLLLS
jgi:hypothetical protein